MTDREKDELAAQVLAVMRARFDPPGPADALEVLDRARRQIEATSLAPPPRPAVPPPSAPARPALPRPAPDLRLFDRCLFVSGALLVAVYFFRLTRPALHVYFSPDDLMNLYRSWIYSAPRLLKANLLFFLNSDFMRPMGSVWYRVIFDFAGLRPFWFHAAGLAILLANVWLTYAVARRLAGSREVAALAALLTAYQQRLGWVYFNTGYIYDVLCYFFLFAALALYLRARARNVYLRRWQWPAFFALYICALNSKEMAVMLPAFLGSYELLYHPPEAWRRASVYRWLAREGRATILTGAVALLFAVGRSFGPLSITTNAAYRPSFSWGQLMLTSGHFMGDALGTADWRAWQVLSLWAALAAFARISRSRVLGFAWLFLMLSPLPIAFIQPRGAAQYYVCMFGWIFYAAVLLVKLATLFSRNAPLPEWWLTRARGTVLFAVSIVILYAVNKPQVSAFLNDDEPLQNRNTVEQLHAAAPSLRHGSRLLFLNDPVPPTWYNLIFIVQLSYADPSLRVFRVKEMKQRPTDQEIAAFDYVFDWRDGRFLALKKPGSAAN